MKILLQTSELRVTCNQNIVRPNFYFRTLSKTSLTDIGTINKAEKIEKGDSRNDAQIDLRAESSFGSWVELHERMTVPNTAVSNRPRGRKGGILTCQSQQRLALLPHERSLHLPRLRG